MARFQRKLKVESHNSTKFYMLKKYQLDFTTLSKNIVECSLGLGLSTFLKKNSASFLAILKASSTEIKSRKTLQTLKNTQSHVVVNLTKSCQIPTEENVTHIGITLSCIIMICLAK